MNDYIAVAKDVPFKEHFLEMTGLSLGVATLSFLVGFVIRNFLGADSWGTKTGSPLFNESFPLRRAMLAFWMWWI